ncbi:hypothetical protein BD779DRAFT_1486946 [Infundibulicybe gibba]|nr:hypothetical protein BD779DRAFT_1486946 [Infundibulicybe gibba]
MHDRAFGLKTLIVVTVPVVLLGIFINKLWLQLGLEATLGLPASVVTHSPRFLSFADTASVVSESYRPLSFDWNNSLILPDTTAVVLNWSRLANVVRIARLLCSDSLNGTIKTVLVWNNSPRELGLKAWDFEASQCPDGKLKIHNSPTNLYFHARFIACAQATTNYCFIQDDDYLIWPEIIQALRMRMESDPPRSGVYLLPPHEKLSSELRKIHTPDGIHTSFAWLGHGAMIHRSMAVDFLALLEYLKLSDEEIKMADNYFTILGNTYPETWFDQGVELGGGQAFTVGPEGDERNNQHITKATELLQSIMTCHQPPCVKPFQGSADIPYVVMENGISPPTRNRSPCIGTLCLFETNIDLLPNEFTFIARLGEERQEYYLSYPPSYAVDGRPETKFQSPRETHPRSGGEWSSPYWLMLPQTDPRSIYFEFQVDDNWMLFEHPLKCFVALSVCSRKIFHKSEPEKSMGHTFRVRLQEDMAFERWSIHEVWLREP